MMNVAQAHFEKEHSSFKMASNSLAGKSAIITGASSGIGEAIAQALVESGCNVVLAARRVDRLNSLKETLESSASQHNAKVLAIKLDVTSSDDWKALVKETKEKLGRIDFLINNAGVMLLSKVLKANIDEWIQMLDINVKGVFLGTAAVLPIFVEQKSGHFINISSDADRKVFPGSAVYSASKAAVTKFSEGLRMELTEAELPVKVTILSPGATATELGSHITDKDVLEGWSKSKPFEFLQAKDIADLVVFALTREGRVNLENILVRPQQQLS